MLASDLESVHGESTDLLRAAVQSVALIRSLVPPIEDPKDDEVIDPYRESAEIHQTSVQQLKPAVDTVTQLLRRALSGTVT